MIFARSLSYCSKFYSALFGTVKVTVVMINKGGFLDKQGIICRGALDQDYAGALIVCSVITSKSALKLSHNCQTG